MTMYNNNKNMHIYIFLLLHSYNTEFNKLVPLSDVTTLACDNHET